MGRCLPAALIALGIVVAASSSGTAMQRSTPAPSALADRLNIAGLGVEGLDAPYNAELERLGELCGKSDDVQACRTRNVRPVAVKVADVRPAPSQASPVIGELYAVLSFHPSYDVGYRMEFRPREAGVPASVWLDSIGDWGYRIEVAGVRMRGTWIQLVSRALPPASWIDIGRLGGGGSIEGHLVTIPSVPAVWPDGKSRAIAEGSYLVQRIRGAQVTLRAEVPSDFPCGEVVNDPPVKPQSVQVAARDLFDPSGSPLFAETYGRGC